jgi:hypothetical protein
MGLETPLSIILACMVDIDGHEVRGCDEVKLTPTVGLLPIGYGTNCGTREECYCNTEIQIVNVISCFYTIKGYQNIIDSRCHGSVPHCLIRLARTKCKVVVLHRVKFVLLICQSCSDIDRKTLGTTKEVPLRFRKNSCHMPVRVPGSLLIC